MSPATHACAPLPHPSEHRLQWEERGGAAVTRTMQAWYDEVKDKPYSLSIAKVVGTSDLKQRSAALKHENFFCSELVACASASALLGGYAPSLKVLIPLSSSRPQVRLPAPRRALDAAGGVRAL